MGRLTGKITIVTGGGTGIGRAIAYRFYREGATVAICGRRRNVLETAKEEILAGGDGNEDRTVYLDTVDVSQSEEVDRFVTTVARAFGGVDILVNNAGIMRFSPLVEMEEDLWSDLLEVNTLGPWRMMKAVYPHMKARGGGAVVNLSSIAGHKSLPNVAGYCSAKAALTMMSQVAALEWAGDGIRVNVIAPGLVEDTELADPIFGKDGVPAFYEKLRSLHPLGRSGTTDDVADLALFLVTEQSSWITGAMIPLDGGRHLATNRPPV